MTEAERAQVLAHERDIIAAEGPYHVEGVYYANPFDADRKRRWTAERRVRETARRERFAAVAAPADALRVTTWLTGRERQCVDAVLSAQVSLTHRPAMLCVRSDLVNGEADAAIVSAALIEQVHVPMLAGALHALPACPVVGLVHDADEPQALAGALRFGHAGVGTVVDARVAQGWQALRSALGPRRVPDTFMRDALTSVLSELTAGGHDLPDGCVRFFRAVLSSRIQSAKQLAVMLGVHSATLTSRFYRAGLPSPKRYATVARLLWFAHLAESAPLSLSAIAHRLDAASPQSFGRSVRQNTGLTAGQFRRTVTARQMLEQFRATLVTPYADTLRTFDPVAIQPRANRHAASFPVSAA